MPIDDPAMTVSGGRGLWIERLLAYALPMSPPIALLLAVIVAVLRRDRFAILRHERWTLGVFSLLGALGVISSLLATSPGQAAIGFSAIAILIFCWMIGRMAIYDPRRFSVDLQRSIGIVGILALLAVFAKVALHISLGTWKLTVVAPEHTGTVFGLGDNGLGPLLVYGGILALGRTVRTWNSWNRLEGLVIFGIALVASLALGVRNALWGSAVGAAVLLPLIGLTALAVVPLAAIVAGQLIPGIWPSFTSLFAGGVWASIAGLLQGGRNPLRWESWQGALRMIRDHPWFGVGPWHFLHVKPLYASGAYPGAGPHSIYLGLAAEWGIPAALLFFGWLALSFVRIWPLRSDGWRWALVAGLASFLAMGIWDNPLFTLHISVPVFLGLGLAQASLETSAELTRPDRPLKTAFSPTSDPSRVES